MPIFPQYYLHKIYQGVDYSVDLTLRNADGTVVDLTGADVEAAIATIDGTGVTSFLATILDAELGRVRVEYPSSYPIIAPGRYLHQLLATLPSEGIRAYYAGDVQSYKNIAIAGNPIADANAIEIGGYPVDLSDLADNYILKFDLATETWKAEPDTGEGGVGTTYTFTAPLSETAGVVAIAPSSGSAAGSMSAADFSKLSEIASGATANATNAELRDRTTHTGTQAIATVTGLQTALDGKEASGTAAAAISAITPTLIGAQPSNANLDALAALAGQTAFGRSLLTLANQAALLAAAGAQAVSSLLSAIAALGSNGLIERTGVGSAAAIAISTTIRNLLGAADQAAARTAIAAQASSDRLTEIAALTPTSGKIIKGNGSSWVLADDNTGGGGGSLPSGTLGQTLRHNGSTFVATNFLTTPDDSNAVFAGGIQAALNIITSPVGSSESAPRVAGFSGLASGQAVRFELGDQYSGFRLGFNRRLQLTSYHGLEIWGSRGTVADFPWTPFTSSDANLSIINSRDVVPLDIFGVSGQTANLLQAQKLGGSITFSVSSEGAIACKAINITGTGANTFNDQPISRYSITTRNEASTTYALQASDNGLVIYFTASTLITVTVPNGLPGGFNVTLVQDSTGQVFVDDPGSAALIVQADNEFKTAKQNAAIALLPTPTANKYTLTGYTAA